MRTGIATIPFEDKKIFYKSIAIGEIPDEPKIPLKNYLLDLVTDTDGKESSIYLKGIEKFIQEIWNEIVKNNWKKLDVRRFVPEKLGIASIYPYKHGRKAISIQNLYKLLLLWQEYCQKTDRDVWRKWEEIYKSDFAFAVHKYSQPTKLPKYLTPKLSYFIGWMCGDGHMTDYGNHYLINTTEKSVKQLKYILQPLFKQLFDVKIPFFTYPRKNVLQLGSKPIFRFLVQVLKIEVGKIPRMVKNLDLINKKYFLRGIFDSEGSVDSSYLDSRIVIHQSDDKFLKEVIELFEDLGIRFTGPYFHQTERGTWYHIQIRKKTDILKFIKEIGTCHIDKFQKIKILEKKLYAHGYCYNPT